jgi:hypothetical protein
MEMADTKAYVCSGTKLKDDNGKMVPDGGIIHLSDELAQHYSAHNVIKPYFPPKVEKVAETAAPKEPASAAPATKPAPAVKP